MRYFPFRQVVVVTALAIGLGAVVALAQTSPYPGIGTPATADDIGQRGWTSGASGKDLPPGQGTAKGATQAYRAKCAMCHGKDGEGVRWAPEAFSPIHGPRLVGGNSTPHFNPQPGQVTTLAYYAPWSTVIFNTIATEMPMFSAATLTADEVYALTAWVLFKNGLIKEDEVMDRTTLPKVQMPNRNAIPASDEIYMDMKKRGCFKTYGDCRDP